VTWRTYSKFFSECIDTLITFTFGLLKKGEATSQKGLLVTGHDLRQYQKAFKGYALLYPIVWSVAQLDWLLYWCSGYMLIVKARKADTVG
jgi:hypothetical protein